MYAHDACQIARTAHAGQTDRFGGLVVDHLARVAAAVPEQVRPVAWLHDILERTDTTEEALRDAGLTPLEAGVLRLLTRDPDERYELYVLGVAFTPGIEGRLARIVKLADLDDHIIKNDPKTTDAPPYAWARRHIANAQDLGVEGTPTNGRAYRLVGASAPAEDLLLTRP